VVSSEQTARPRGSLALKETMWLALDTLRAHKLRSFLTLLGVILAVCTLVVVMSVIEGLNRFVAEKIANLGANVFIVNQMGIITSHEEWLRARKRPPVTIEDYEYLREHLKLARQVGAADDARADVRFGNQTLEDVLILGVTANVAELRSIEVGHGRYISESDDAHRAAVCFIGTDLVERFFPHSDPVGKSLWVGGNVYEIIGVAQKKGSVLGQSQDNFVHIPLGQYLKSWSGPQTSIFTMVQALGPDWLDAAQDEARALMRARRKVSYKDEDNFGVIAPGAITGLFEEMTSNIFRIAVGLTSVFLVVGGIVIMNIMLASVTERTREIGIRKSLGARRRHIVMQFLVESATLAAVGGLIGVIGATVGGKLVTALTSFPIVTPLHAFVIALGLSTSVGLFFGIYPAMRAARLDPIEALRFEV
jgi:putative ABC transport system permease protein